MAVQVRLIGGAGIRRDDDMKVVLEAVPRRRRHTAFGGQTGQHQRVDASGLQLLGQTGAGEGAVAARGYALTGGLKLKAWRDKAKAGAGLITQMG